MRACVWKGTDVTLKVNLRSLKGERECQTKVSKCKITATPGGTFADEGMFVKTAKKDLFYVILIMQTINE